MSKLIPWLPNIQIALSALLALSVLLQNRGAAVGAAFGGAGTIYRTKRGLEKTLFRATIALAVLFAGTSLLRLALG